MLPLISLHFRSTFSPFPHKHTYNTQIIHLTWLESLYGCNVLYVFYYNHFATTFFILLLVYHRFLLVCVFASEIGMCGCNLRYRVLSIVESVSIQYFLRNRCILSIESNQILRLPITFTKCYNRNLLSWDRTYNLMNKMPNQIHSFYGMKYAQRAGQLSNNETFFRIKTGFRPHVLLTLVKNKIILIGSLSFSLWPPICF